MATDPEKSRKPSAESVEYQPKPSQGDPTTEPETAQEISERRSVETDTETREDSMQR
jgi:hypothetical protein